MVVARGRGMREFVFNGWRVSVWEDEEALQTWMMVVDKQSGCPYIAELYAYKTG